MSSGVNGSYRQNEIDSANRPTLKPKGGIFAREPILDELGKRLGAYGPERNACQIPLLVMFGDHDWLNYEGSSEDIHYLKSVHGVNAKLEIIGSAGHHLYIENPIGFSESLISWEKENSSD